MGQTEDEVFATIQDLVIQHPVLKFYNEEEDVTIQTDASDKGLVQNGQTVAFAPELSPRQSKDMPLLKRSALQLRSDVKASTNIWLEERGST